MSKKLEIKIESIEKSGKEFVKAWHLAEKAGDSMEPKETLTFTSLQAMLNALTPKRLELLSLLYDKGPTSVRSLSKLLNRDYHNVHRDVEVLENCWLISRKEDKPYVPWLDVIASLSLRPEIKDNISKKAVNRTTKRHKRAS